MIIALNVLIRIRIQELQFLPSIYSVCACCHWRIQPAPAGATAHHSPDAQVTSDTGNILHETRLAPDSLTSLYILWPIKKSPTFKKAY